MKNRLIAGGSRIGKTDKGTGSKAGKRGILCLAGALLCLGITFCGGSMNVLAAEQDELPASIILDAEETEILPAQEEESVVTEPDAAVTEEVSEDPAVLGENRAPEKAEVPEAPAAPAAAQDGQLKPQKGSKNVEDALKVIFADHANVARQKANNPERFVREGRYKEILAGVYTQNAVAVFLDHGYYRDKEAELRKAGLLPADYVMSDTPYVITRTGELLRYPEKEDAFETYVLVTDSVYLQTYQLLEIAEWHHFVESSEFLTELDTFENGYICRQSWLDQERKHLAALSN